MKTFNHKNNSETTTLVSLISFFRNLFTKKVFEKKFEIKLYIQYSFVFSILIFINQCATSHPSSELARNVSAGNISGVKAAIAAGGLRPEYTREFNRQDPLRVHAIVINDAITKNNKEVLKVLLQGGANPNSLNNGKRNSLLGMTSPDCKVEFFKLLLDYGADPNYIYRSGSSTYTEIDLIEECIEDNERNEMLKYIKKNQSNKKNQNPVSDFSDTLILKSGQTISNVKTKIAGDSIIVDYPNGESKVYKKTQVQSVDRK